MAFSYLKVKSAKYICLLPVVLVLVLRIWSCLHRCKCQGRLGRKRVSQRRPTVSLFWQTTHLFYRIIWRLLLQLNSRWCDGLGTSLIFWRSSDDLQTARWLELSLYRHRKAAKFLNKPPPVWPHLFRGAGHEKRRGEQLKWSLAFSLYIGSFPCTQLPGPVHTARLGRVCF